jgi:Flp pilus assembly protein CpaB
MKQKNLILVAVAVGCGLVAAFLTSQIGARPAQAEQVEIPVAAKELPVGTKLSKDQIDALVTFKKISKDSLPASYAGTKEEMVDKRLIRTIRAGEPFNPQDLSTNAVITPPAGFNMMTFHATPEKGVAGFAGPGSRVDILCSVRAKKTGKVEVFPLLLDMLVLAIDTNVQGAQQGAIPNMSMVSLAVNNTHAKLLHAAINRGADLRLILRNVDNPAKWEKVPSEEQIWAILQDDENGSSRSGDGKVTVKLPVPVEDLPAGTELTAEVIEKKFKLMEVGSPAPTQFALDLHEHAGRFLLRDLSADQFVPRSALGEKNQQPKPGPDLSQAPTPKSEPADPAKPKVEETKPVFWDATIQTANGVKKYRYQVINGDYRYVGEVKENGAVSKPAKSPNQVTPPAPPAPESKHEEGGRAI